MSADNRELKRAGLKATVPRLKILEMLESSDKHHLSAEDVYRELLEAGDDVGLATIYRVLTQFESAGLVSRLLSWNAATITITSYVSSVERSRSSSIRPSKIARSWWWGRWAMRSRIIPW